eukprot:TRINITY_DN8748_c0_g1_i1.p1 TRINITY_DN8748_c0_g1~~TRINITY_DN8748_c0_g1_i1.p1  ORF type:complete len:231 (+),score=13.90 TRINITY_DN8748_c0_g1_i1:246-938(+)
MPIERYHPEYKDSVFRGLNHKVLDEIIRICDNPRQTSLQTCIYNALVTNHDRSDFATFIRWHNLRHFRKLKVQAAGELCDDIVKFSSLWIDSIRKSKNKYGILSICKFCTDSFCIPARFGQRAPCPFCKASDSFSHFCLTHVAKCADFLLVCSEILKPAHVDVVLSVLNSDELVDNRFWLLYLIMQASKPKLREAVVEIFAVAALVIASGVNQPHLNSKERISTIKATQA